MKKVTPGTGPIPGGAEKPQVVEFCPDDRDARLRTIIAMARTARDDAVELDLEFEAYLLDMAVIALSETVGD